MSEQDISNESVRGTCNVFITYSHESPEHRHRVLALAERLRKDGVDASLINTQREHQQEVGPVGWRTNWIGPSSF